MWEEKAGRSEYDEDKQKEILLIFGFQIKMKEIKSHPSNRMYSSRKDPKNEPILIIYSGNNERKVTKFQMKIL